MTRARWLLALLPLTAFGFLGQGVNKVVSVTISPASFRLETADTAAATCHPVNQFGQELTRTCVWASTNSGVATTRGQQSQFTAVTGVGPGTAAITATVGGKSARVGVTVSRPDTSLASLALLPSTASLLVGGTAPFSVTGVRANGMSVTPAVTYAATGGTVSVGGLYTAGMTPGTYRVTATAGNGVADTSVVLVSAPPVTLSRVLLTPAVDTVAAGASQAFTVLDSLSDGTAKAFAGRCTATGGSIAMAPCTYLAGPTAGTYSVVAAEGAQADTSAVLVTAAAPAPCSGIAVAPGDSVQAAVNAAGTSATFCFSPGVYRMQAVTPKANDVFLGPLTAIFSGSRLLTSWTPSGNVWYASGQTQQGTVATGDTSLICKAGHPRCLYPEDVFVDDTIQTHVASLAAVSSGKWFFDYSADRIYLGTDPTGRKVETSVLPKAFGGAATHVVLKGFTVEKYAAPYNAGAIHINGTAWVVDTGMRTRWNHAAGVATFGANDTVRGGTHSQNGQYGVLGNGARGLVVDGNTLNGDNIAGFSQSWAAGAGKWSNTSGLLLRNNVAQHNLGHAFWLDIDNDSATVEYNLATDNDGRGVFYEIGWRAWIRHNTFARNGALAPVLLRGGCVGVVSSPNVEVDHNTCDGDKDGITGVQDARGSGIRNGVSTPHSLDSLYVHDNTIRNITAFAAGIVQTVSDTTYYHRGNRFVSNTYSGLVASPFYWLSAARDSVYWIAHGQH